MKTRAVHRHRPGIIEAGSRVDQRLDTGTVARRRMKVVTMKSAAATANSNTMAAMMSAPVMTTADARPDVT